MTGVIDLRGSGIVARAGLESPVQKGSGFSGEIV